MAEVSQLNIAEQFGLTYLPMMILRDQRLIEKHAVNAALGDIKVNWTRLGGGGAGANEALFSGAVHITSGGVAPLVTLWARTKDTPQEVKGICAMNSMPGYLVTRNPGIKSVKDYTDKSRIAVPAIRVSNQALLLAMAAEREFGVGQQDRLDPITVALPLPDGHAALLSGTEIDSQYSAPPYQYQALAQPGIHRVLSSYDLFGGPHTLNVIWATKKFHDENPKTYAAFLAAYREATDILNRDKRAAAELYVRVTKEKTSVDAIHRMLIDPEIRFTLTPEKIHDWAKFMFRVNRIKAEPASWKQMFFPEIHDLAGS
jgi:NitT/TauT family transport system substrate-binding protein